jgi:hypothetical protein
MAVEPVNQDATLRDMLWYPELIFYNSAPGNHDYLRPRSNVRSPDTEQIIREIRNKVLEHPEKRQELTDLLRSYIQKLRELPLINERARLLVRGPHSMADIERSYSLVANATRQCRELEERINIALFGEQGAENRRQEAENRRQEAENRRREEFNRMWTQADNLPLRVQNNQRRGIAYEVHNSWERFKNEKLEKYLNVINEHVSSDDKYKNIDIVDYVKQKMNDFILNNFEETDKQQSFDQLEVVLNKFNLCEIPRKTENKILIGKSIDFIFEQPKELIQSYISTFIYDNYNAYSGGIDNSSCANGILERFVLIVGDAVFIYCSFSENEKCKDGKLYNKILNVFNKIFDKNELTKEWSDKYLESDELKNMTKEQRKEHYIHFMIQNAKNNELYDENIDKIIRDEAEQLDYVFETLAFGGKKRIKKRIKRRTLKRNKQNTKSKGKNKKKKTMKRRNITQKRKK